METTRNPSLSGMLSGLVPLRAAERRFEPSYAAEDGPGSRNEPPRSTRSLPPGGPCGSVPGPWLYYFWHSADYYSQSPGTDPQGAPGGEEGVERGGSVRAPRPCCAAYEWANRRSAAPRGTLTRR